MPVRVLKVGNDLVSEVLITLNIKSNKEKIGLINDITSKSLSAKKIDINSDFSNNYFNKIGLEWLNIDDDYIKKYISLGDIKNEEK